MSGLQATKTRHPRSDWSGDPAAPRHTPAANLCCQRRVWQTSAAAPQPHTSATVACPSDTKSRPGQANGAAPAPPKPARRLPGRLAQPAAAPVQLPAFSLAEVCTCHLEASCQNTQPASHPAASHHPSAGAVQPTIYWHPLIAVPAHDLRRACQPTSFQLSVPDCSAG